MIVVVMVWWSEAWFVFDFCCGAESYIFIEFVVFEWIVGAGAGCVVVEEIGGDL